MFDETYRGSCSNVVDFPIGINFIDTQTIPEKFCIFRPGMHLARTLREGQRINLWNMPAKDSHIKALIGVGTVKMLQDTIFDKALAHAGQSDWAQQKGFTGDTARAWVKEMMEEEFSASNAQIGSTVSVVYLSTI